MRLCGYYHSNVLGGEGRCQDCTFVHLFCALVPSCLEHILATIPTDGYLLFLAEVSHTKSVFQLTGTSVEIRAQLLNSRDSIE